MQNSFLKVRFESQREDFLALSHPLIKFERARLEHQANRIELPKLLDSVEVEMRGKQETWENRN